MKIAFTFDDLISSSPAESAYFSHTLLQTIEAIGVKTLGFSNPGTFAGNESIISEFACSHWLGNHTFSHMDYENSGFEAFCDDVIRAEAILEKYYSTTQGERRFFRFPRLRRGRTPQERRRILAFLHEHHYRLVPPAFDSYDWLFARYLRNGHAGVEEKLGELYIGFAAAHIEATYRLMKKIYQRPVPLIGLFHWNAFNARHLPLLLRALQGSGFSFCDIEEALADPVYRATGHIYKTSQLVHQPYLPLWLKAWNRIAGNRQPYYVLRRKIERLAQNE